MVRVYKISGVQQALLKATHCSKCKWERIALKENESQGPYLFAKNVRVVPSSNPSAGYTTSWEIKKGEV